MKRSITCCDVCGRIMEDIKGVTILNNENWLIDLLDRNGLWSWGGSYGPSDEFYEVMGFCPGDNEINFEDVCSINCILKGLDIYQAVILAAILGLESPQWNEIGITIEPNVPCYDRSRDYEWAYLDGIKDEKYISLWDTDITGISINPDFYSGINEEEEECGNKIE